MEGPAALGTFARTCALIETALTGSFREEILNEASKSREFGKALARLRDSMHANVWTAGPNQIDVDKTIRKYDRQTRDDGFHALHDWDGIADKVNPDIIPIDVLNFLITERGDEETDRAALAILLDYYFLHVLGLLSLRAWDEGSADDNLDRIGELLGHLQGPCSSGQKFADDAETLLLIATSHYELAEWGYDKLLARVKTLNGMHQTRIALGHAPSIGSHLRFGFEATYGRDTINMRDDNVADYPWLCFALVTLMREYSRLSHAGVHGLERERVVEAMLDGLTPDARAFVGDPPKSLSACEVDRGEFRDGFHRHQASLLQEFERHRPTERAYSPLSFFFNFSHNVVKGTVVDALLRGAPWELTLNDLLTGLPAEAAKSARKTELARTLMAYARTNPNPIRGRLMPVIVYDPQKGHPAFAVTMRKLRE